MDNNFLSIPVFHASTLFLLLDLARPQMSFANHPEAVIFPYASTKTSPSISTDSFSSLLPFAEEKFDSERNKRFAGFTLIYGCCPLDLQRNDCLILAKPNDPLPGPVNDLNTAIFQNKGWARQ